MPGSFGFSRFRCGLRGCATCLLATGLHGAFSPSGAEAAASEPRSEGGESDREASTPAEERPVFPADLADVPRQALAINPVGSVLSSALAGARFELDSLFSVALRYERAVSSHWGWVATPHYAQASILSVRFRSLGIKVGPRYSPLGEGLRGAYVLPMALLGNGWVHQPNRRLVSQLLLGLGLEGGYVWGWGPWQVEAGAGLNYSGYLHHDTFDGLPPRSAGWGPLLNTSVGYAW